MKNSQLVYSTNSNKHKCPTCGQYECICETKADKCPTCGQYECICETKADAPLAGQTAKITIDRKGRKGKSMTVIEGLKVNPMHLAEIARLIKQKMEQGRIEIQGEHRDKVASILQEMGVKTIFSGG